jgi:hypothetical protein
VAKEKPELLEADTDSDTVEQLIGRLITAAPEPKRQKGGNVASPKPERKSEV